MFELISVFLDGFWSTVVYVEQIIFLIRHTCMLMRHTVLEPWDQPVVECVIILALILLKLIYLWEHLRKALVVPEAILLLIM